MYLNKKIYLVLFFVCLFFLDVSAAHGQCSELRCSSTTSSGEIATHCFSQSFENGKFIHACDCDHKDFLFDLIGNGSIADLQNQKFQCQPSQKVLLAKKYRNEDCSSNSECHSKNCLEGKCAASLEKDIKCSIENLCDRGLEGQTQFCNMKNSQCESSKREDEICSSGAECDYGLYCNTRIGLCKPYKSVPNSKKVLMRGFNIECASLYSEMNSCEEIQAPTNQQKNILDIQECLEDADCSGGQAGSCVCGINNNQKKYCKLSGLGQVKLQFEKLLSKYLESERTCPPESKIDFGEYLCDKSSEIVEQIKTLQQAHLYYAQFKNSGCPEEALYSKALSGDSNKIVEVIKSEETSTNIYLGVILGVIIVAGLLFLWRKKRSTLLKQFEYEEKPNNHSQSHIKSKSLTLENNPNSSKQLDNEIQFEDDNIHVKHSTQNNQLKKIDEDGNQLETTVDKNLKFSSSSLEDSVQYSIEDDEDEMSNSNVFNLEGESSRSQNSARKRKSGRRVSKKNLTGTPKSPGSNQNTNSNSNDGSSEKD